MQITEKKLLNIKQFKKQFKLQTPKIIGESKIQGWGSDSPAFSKVIEITKPKTIIEVGTWLGASAFFMSELLEQQNIDFEMICVDTFLGSNSDLWIEQHLTNLNTKFDSIYNQFCVNVTNKNLNDKITPLPMTSSSAAELLQKFDVKADLIYIDAGHRERELYADLQDWWPLAKKGIIGDDYSPTWPGVMAGADRFANENNLNLEIVDSKFLLIR
jgi:hypothetical protein